MVTYYGNLVLGVGIGIHLIKGNVSYSTSELSLYGIIRILSVLLRFLLSRCC